MEKEMEPKHPMQPLVRNEHNTVRFKKNSIVRFLLDAGPFDLNQIWAMPNILMEDMVQFYQLIGYSVGGFGEIFYEKDEKAVEEADRKAEEFIKLNK